MDEKKEDKILDHNYDGIREYDNDLPRWWLALFWGGIIFGIIYLFYFHVGPGKFTTDLVDEKVAEVVALQQAQQQKSAESVSEESLLTFAKVQAHVDSGKIIYAEKCAACHGPEAAGLIGPNMTDNSWIHGGKLLDIRRVIVEGVPEKGMIAWGTLLKEEQIQQLIAFLHSIRGTNVANGKAPEGEEFIYTE